MNEYQIIVLIALGYIASQVTFIYWKMPRNK